MSKKPKPNRHTTSPPALLELPTTNDKASLGEKVGVNPDVAPRANVANPIRGSKEGTTQAKILAFVRMYGPNVKKWDYFTEAAADFDLDPKDITDARLLSAYETLTDEDVSFQDNVRKHNKTSRLQVVLQGGSKFTSTTASEDENDDCKPVPSPAPKTVGTTDVGSTYKDTDESMGKQKRKRSAMGCLEAAALVLREEGRPMATKELIDVMAARCYWQSPGGLTPWATLSAAIGVDMRRNSDSPFLKVGRGLFAVRG